MQITGMGKSGTYKNYLSVGPTAQALSGLTHMSGLPDPMPPAGWGYSYLDHSPGYYGAIYVLAALLRRKRTGSGCYIDLSQTETGLMVSGTAILEAQLTGRPTERHGNRMHSAAWAPHGAYPCRGTDEWIAIAVQTDAEWQARAAPPRSPATGPAARVLTPPRRKGPQGRLRLTIGGCQERRS